MALMLNDMKEGVSDKVAEKVVDTFLRESEILQMLPFDNTVSPQGGSTLTYSYMQKQIPYCNICGSVVYSCKCLWFRS